MAAQQDEKAVNSPDTLVGTSKAQLDLEKNSALPEKAVLEHRSSSLDEHGSHQSVATEDSGERSRVDLERVASRKRPIVTVPRGQRRGLFARFAIIPEVTEPKDYDRGIKWFITFVVAVAAAAAPLGSAIILPSLSEIAVQMNSTPTTTNLSVALYMLSMAIFPLWWSAFSETTGRRTVYLTSFAMFIVFSILGAVSKNIAMLIVFRMLAGGAAASVQAVGAGTIADIWEVFERGRAMGWFYLGPLCGPLFAPIIGGALSFRLGWRSAQYAMAVYGLLIWVFVFFALPETLKSIKSYAQEAEQAVAATRPPLTRTSTKQSVQQRSLRVAKVARMVFVDPLRVILYLRFPAVLLTVYYASVTFGSLYVLNISIEYTFKKEPYDFSTLIIGLLYIPNSLGYFLASFVGGRWMDAIMAREAIKANRVQADGKLIYRPEDRMRENAWLGAFLYPAALIWYGWTVEKGVFWLVPMVANFFYGVGSMLIFAMATTMLTEFMPGRSSSGAALNNLIRNILSCVGGIVGAPIIAAIGNGWLFTILGGWALSSCMVIWAMRRFGPQWRISMDQKLNR